MNLRTDLAQLTDAELAKRLEDQWNIIESAKAKRWFWGPRWTPLFYSFRGPIKHPRAYRFFLALSGSGNGWLDILFAIAFSDKRAEKFLRGADPLTDSHLSLCEIRDIIDEGERRLAQRKERTS
jgi:hypothetical protein